MKNRYIKYYLSIILASIFTAGFAQTEEDALRYSNLQFGGTARYLGVSGAFGALGADISVLSVNPAGMARYKKSEFTFTPNISLSNTESRFNSSSMIAGKENLNVGSFGIVGVTKQNPEKQSKWNSIQFGFAYNRLADFNESFQINGNNQNNYNSMSHVFALRSLGSSPESLLQNDPFYGDLAYQTYITDYDSTTGFYSSRMNSQSIHHDHVVNRKGRVGEYSIAISGNYNQKFYIGGSVGIPKVHFEETKSHSEVEIADSTEFTHSFTFNEYNFTRGNGINAKIGCIILPTQWLRLGLAYHTRTFYNLTDNWNTSMNSRVSETETYSYSSFDGNYRYQLTTPSRLIGSASLIIAKKALISVDYSRINHSTSRLSPDTYYGGNYEFNAENSAIDSNYKAVNNIQIGSEMKLGDFYMIRAGYAIFQNPYSDLNDNSFNRSSYSLGIGYRNKKYFFDLGARYSIWKENYYMYDPSIVANSEIDKSLLNISFTIGFKW
ncbi:MAG: hypothetical protein CL853_01075 [Crocinitomicaceae bacterium]|nr:hypothetical protein [Crocinitomicaceae bacterium]|tara:strand:- start:2049 stop:3533 length:1485 start_codon:yes stop_codon:yes gene_type:complete